MTTHADIAQVLVSEEQIQARIRELAAQINHDYQDRPPLLVGVLKGVLFLMADLMRALSVPAEMDFMAVSNYTPDSRDRGLVRLVKDLESPIADRHVIFVEDMIDTGLTLNYLLNNLRARKPASLEVCALLSKPAHRLIDIPVRYLGFELPEDFVVGYGLDYREHYRGLPYVGTLKPEAWRSNSPH